MLRRVLPAVVLAALAVPAPAQEADGSKVYKKVVPSTVWVQSKRDRGTATGSGSLIDKDRRLVLTNYHVVEETPTATVFFPAFRNGVPIPEKSYYRDRERTLGVRGRVVARDKVADLAVIQIEEVPKDVPAIPVAAGGAEAGQTVHSIGNPGTSDALWGYVRGTVRQVYRKKWRAKLDASRTLNFEARVVETDSPTNPGDSGGPLVNGSGELVGVTQGGAAAEAANSVSFFVDVSEVRRLINSDDVKRVRGGKPPEPAPAAALPATKREKPAAVADKAKLFTDETAKKVQEQIDELHAKRKFDVLVETYPTAPAADLEKVKGMTATDRTAYMRKWAHDRMQAEKVTGFIVLISNDPKSLYVTVSHDAEKPPLTREFVGKVRDTVIDGLKNNKRDDAVLEAMKMIREKVAAK